MRFPKKISEFFATQKYRFKIRRAVRLIEAELPVFRIINIDQEILSESDRRLHTEKTTRAEERFMQSVRLAKQHNETIKDLQTRLDEVISSGGTDEIVGNIENYTFDQIYVYNDLALRISEFTIPNSPNKEDYLRFLKGIGEIFSDYPKIFEQFGLIRKFEQFRNSFPDEYIDGEREKEFFAEATELLTRIKALGSKYYKLLDLDKRIVTHHNEDYIERHSKDHIFDDINGRSLDDEQRRAILCDPGSNLTIAGAGAGKTLTICGKVKWLTNGKKFRMIGFYCFPIQRNRQPTLQRKSDSCIRRSKSKHFMRSVWKFCVHITGRKTRSKISSRQSFRIISIGNCLKTNQS